MQHGKRVLHGSGCTETNNGQHLIEIDEEAERAHCVQCALIIDLSPVCKCGHTWHEHAKPATKISWDACSFPCLQCACSEYDQVVAGKEEV